MTDSEIVTYTWTGPANIKWIRKPPLLCIILSHLLPVVLASVGTFLFLTGDGATMRSLPSLPEEQKSSNIAVIETTPLEIKLKILAKEKFETERLTPDTVAQTAINTNPCTIIIPEGWQIYLTLQTGNADWLHSANGQTLAHEIAHCLVGSWHPEYDVLMKNRAKQTMPLTIERATPSNE